MAAPMIDTAHAHTSLRRWALWLLALYGAVVALVLVAPVSYAAVVESIGEWLRAEAGATWFGYGWIEFAGNVAMFLPLGLLLTLLFRRPWVGVGLALAFSVAAEAAQILLPSRAPTVRDVVANALGAGIGALIAWGVLAHRTRSRRTDAHRTQRGAR